VNGPMPDTMLVMIHDEQAAGRIVVELDAFVRFNARIEDQLVELERLLLASHPRWARRGGAERQKFAPTAE
jgi:hypothetical protein